jgi:hypothetical protein
VDSGPAAEPEEDAPEVDTPAEDEAPAEEAPEVVEAEVEPAAVVSGFGRPSWCDHDRDHHVGHRDDWWHNGHWWRDHDGRDDDGDGDDEDGDDTVTYDNCDDVRDAGAAPIFWWEDGFADRLDSDDDGIGCEWGGSSDSDDDNGDGDNGDNGDNGDGDDSSSDSDGDSSDDSSSSSGNTVSVSDYGYSSSIPVPLGGVATGGDGKK